MELLASTLFALNSIVHSYSKLKSVEMPPEFVYFKLIQEKVKEYYMKVKNALNGVEEKPNRSNANPVVVNKDAAARLIANAIK